MLPLIIEPVQGAKPNILLRIERGGQPRFIRFNPDLQQIIFNKLRNRAFKLSLSPRLVFDRLQQVILAQKGCLIEEKDIDLSALAEMIGHLNGVWEDPRQYPVLFHPDVRNDKSYGITISLPQREKNGTIKVLFVSNGAQKYIFQAACAKYAAADTLKFMKDMYKNEAPNLTVPNEETIRRLRYIIKERLLVHPSSENAHWEMVQIHYEDWEKRTVVALPLQLLPAAASGGSFSEFFPPQSSR